MHKQIFVHADDQNSLKVHSFGLSSDPQYSRWGKGVRDTTILHYILSGSGFYNNHLVQSGEGFYIQRNQLHEYHPNPEQPWTYFWIILSGNLSDLTVQKYINADDNGIFTFSFRDQLEKFVFPFFDQYNTVTPTKALGIFFLLMSYHETTHRFPSNQYVIEAKQYMEKNIHHPFTIADIAQILHISDRYLYNLFIQFEGIPPKRFLNTLRLQRAKNLLSNSSITITEIANSCGFSDVLCFSRFFSQQTGLSPTKYRQHNNQL